LAASRRLWQPPLRSRPCRARRKRRHRLLASRLTPSASTTPASGGAAQLTGTAPATCEHPQYTTSATLGMWHLPPYFVYNNMWDIAGYQVSQTL
jgi:hypothetical protein